MLEQEEWVLWNTISMFTCNFTGITQHFGSSLHRQLIMSRHMLKTTAAVADVAVPGEASTSREVRVVVTDEKSDDNLFETWGSHGGGDIVSWVAKPCGLVGIYQRFGGRHCFHPHGVTAQKTDIDKHISLWGMTANERNARERWY
jgi:hypothetical protein